MTASKSPVYNTRDRFPQPESVAPADGSRSPMLLFIHVPKTAGSSFRISLAKSFGKNLLALDYGDKSSVTSELVTAHIYAGDDSQPRRRLIRALREKECKVLAGHFYYRKYGRFFAAEKIICFIREPLHRLASEYLHKQRLEAYPGSFEEFVELRRNRNLQSAYLAGLPAGSFVGITEHYRESLQLLSRLYGTRFKVSKRNVAPDGGAGKFVKSLPESSISRFYDLNREDIELYENHRSLFQQRFMNEFARVV